MLLINYFVKYILHFIITNKYKIKNIHTINHFSEICFEKKIKIKK